MMKIDPTKWTAVDGLGRTVDCNAQTGDSAGKQDKLVGMFYWTWHSQFAHREPCNVSALLEEYPDAKNNFQHTAWAQTSNARYFWNEPLYGYYNSNDMYVIRKHAELLADAGVDVLFFDCTNGTEIFLKETTLLMEVFAEAVKEGVNVPKVAFMLNIDHDVMMENNKTQNQAVETMAATFEDIEQCVSNIEEVSDLSKRNRFIILKK